MTASIFEQRRCREKPRCADVPPCADKVASLLAKADGCHHAKAERRSGSRASAQLLASADRWTAALPAPQALPEDLIAEGHTIPVPAYRACTRASAGPPPGAARLILSAEASLGRAGNQAQPAIKIDGCLRCSLPPSTIHHRAHAELSSIRNWVARTCGPLVRSPSDT
jgi:hypothetical protein